MRQTVFVAILAGALAACGQPSMVTGEPGATGTGTTTSSPSPRTRPVLPNAPRPAATGTCPYLDTGFVAQANGQRVAEVKVSERTEGPHRSCFFYRPDGALQLAVRVYVGEPSIALGLVDQATPVASSNPASRPVGWNGGYLATDSSAVYAVFKDDTAVLVTTNQAQTIKARRVAEQVIAALAR